VRVDGKDAGILPRLNPTQAGVCYLRLRSTAGAADTAGFLVERVAADVTP
jgi:hypothetical protein